MGETTRRVTLTFDNGPSSETTPRVLDVLAERDLFAWFCVVGNRVSEPGGAALVARTLSEGHQIVNHSMSHHTPLGDEPTIEHAQLEIVEAERLLSETVGDWGPRWYRPFGRGGQLGPHVFSPAALDVFAEREYSVLLWNSVPRDWVDTSGWVETALADVDARDHTVVVIHDLPTGAMAHLTRFLDELAEREVLITLDPAPDCVPIRNGVPQFELDDLTANSTH